MFIEASEVPLPSLGNEEQDFNGFNTVIDEIEAIMSLIENNKKAYEAKVWKIVKRVSNITSNIKRKLKKQ